MQRVEHAHKLGTVESICGCVPAARKHTQLEELSDGPILGHLWREKRDGGERDMEERERERERGGGG